MSDLPSKYGGLAAFTTWAYKYGQYTIGHTVIFQDSDGSIKQVTPGSPAKNDTIVSSSLNPSRNGFSLVGWNPDVQGAQKLELRLYWIDTSGKIFERCYSRNGGPDAVWYDGSLTGQFTAAPYSSIAANSQSGAKTRVYFQEAETNKIRELYKEGGGTFDPFTLLDKTRPDALRGTWIATDSNINGAAEVYYQSPALDWVIDGAGVNSGFKPQDEFPYAPGAPIAVSGSVTQGGARVFTVNKEGRLVITMYDKSSLSWKPSAELVKVQNGKQIWALNHPQMYHGSLFRHPTTAFVSQSQNLRVITKVGFTDTTFEGWDVLPSDNVPIS